MAINRQEAKEKYGYTDEEIDSYLASKAELGGAVSRTSPGYSEHGVPLNAAPYPGGSDAPDAIEANPVNPIDEAAAFFGAGPIAAGAKSLVGGVASRLAPQAGGGMAREAGKFALEEAMGPLGRAASRFGGMLKRGGEAAQQAVEASPEYAKQVFGKSFSRFGEVTKQAESTVGRIVKEAQRQFGKGVQVSENGSRYVIRDAGGTKIGSGDSFKEAVEAGHKNLGTARKAIRIPKGKVVGEIKPVAKPKAPKGSAASRVADAEAPKPRSGVFRTAGEASKPELERRAYAQVVATGRLLKGQELSEKLMEKALAERAAKVPFRSSR